MWQLDWRSEGLQKTLGDEFDKLKDKENTDEETLWVLFGCEAEKKEKSSVVQYYKSGSGYSSLFEIFEDNSTKILAAFVRFFDPSTKIFKFVCVSTHGKKVSSLIKGRFVQVFENDYKQIFYEFRNEHFIHAGDDLTKITEGNIRKVLDGLSNK